MIKSLWRQGIKYHYINKNYFIQSKNNQESLVGSKNIYIILNTVTITLIIHIFLTIDLYWVSRLNCIFDNYYHDIWDIIKAEKNE